MRRLISMLAAGVLAAGTVLTTAGVASAGATAVRHQGCTPERKILILSSVPHRLYWLGTPNKLSSGAAAILKPRANSTTQWAVRCRNHGTEVVLTNRGMALTSSASSPGADVTMEPTGNGGNGLASQRWAVDFNGPPGSVPVQNVKTGLFLRVRNSRPHLYQTVTTGRSATYWLF